MKKWVISLAVIAACMGFGFFVAINGGHDTREKEPVTATACTTGTDAFTVWVEDQSQLYGEDLRDRYGIQAIRAVCGSVTVDTLIADDATGHALAEAACNTLSQAVNEVASVSDVTVRYGTGKNACYQWPSGPSNF